MCVWRERLRELLNILQQKQKSTYTWTKEEEKKITQLLYMLRIYNKRCDFCNGGRMPWFSSIFVANYVEHINWVSYFAFASTFWCMLSSLPVLKSKVCDDGNKIITMLMQAWINSNITFSMHPCLFFS